MKIDEEVRNYLTGTRGRERKRRGREQTPTPTGPERANPEKAREKKNGGRRTRNRTSGRGGKDGSA